ncbi:MAG: hypothetical protein WKH47_03080, partial [Actinomycetes bacterium]
VAQAGHLGERPGDARTQVRALADELGTTARANRDLLVGLVRMETERAVAAIGVASTDDVAAIRRRLDGLERRVGDLATAARGTGTNAPASAPATKSAPAKSAPAKSAPAKSAPAKSAPATKSALATKSAPAKKAMPPNSAAAPKKGAAKKAAPDQQSTAKKAATAKQASANRPTASRPTANRAAPPTQANR